MNPSTTASAANTQSAYLAWQQLLEALRLDAPSIANTLADEVWDSFEVEVEQFCADSVCFDFVAPLGMGLSTQLSLDYDTAFERHVLAQFEQLNARLAPNTPSASEQAASEPNSSAPPSSATPAECAAPFDSARIDLSGLRKGLKLRRHAHTLIEQAIERAKPGVGALLGGALGSLWRDPEQEMDALEREHQANARRLRASLLELRSEVCTLIRNESLATLEAAQLELGRQLRQRA